ncbi:MAG: chorismate-binding protein [Simkaniaceae bacterium]|nr:chorismate-binding protein [Simkaniaceae bacterium]
MPKIYWDGSLYKTPWPKPHPLRANIISRVDRPNYEEFCTLVEKFHASGIKKAVVARETTLNFDGPLCPFDLLKRLPKASVKFAIVEGDTTFFGATPEHLYMRVGREIFTEAVAGTNLDKECLLGSEKDLHEFNYVSDFLHDELKELCCEYQASNLGVKKAGPVYHLHRKFTGILKNEINDTEIIKRLHPTPAIGGVPRDEALCWIAENEFFPRGRYSAPIGWTSSDRAEIAVAIRSARLDRRSLKIYAGLGLVDGSTPIVEWKELECKIAQWMVLLQQPVSLKS